MHPVLFTGAKQAVEDEVIPLSRPLKLPDGRSITEIPVSKGQNIWINIPGYNRLSSIFGENANEFNVDRWLDGSLDDLPGLVGVYGNLVTFGHGPHACIGEHLPSLPLIPCTLCVLIFRRMEIQCSRDADHSCGAVGELRVPPTQGLQRCKKDKRHGDHDPHHPGGQRSRNEAGSRGFYPPGLNSPFVQTRTAIYNRFPTGTICATQLDPIP
jgi:hypothetical protein